MLRRRRVRRQPVGREIPQVPGHDHVRPYPDRCRLHVAVSRIGQVEIIGERRVPRHDGFRKVPVHDRPGPCQHGGVEIQPVCQEAPRPLGMDVRAPERREQVPVGQSQEHVPEPGRIERIGVEQRPPPRHRLLQAEFLVAGHQLVQRRTAAGFSFAAVGHDVCRADAAMRPHLPAGNPPVIEELHQVRPRHLQQVGGLPRRQLGMHWRQYNAMPVRHLVQNLPEQLHRRRGNVDRLRRGGTKAGRHGSGLIVQRRQFPDSTLGKRSVPGAGHAGFGPHCGFSHHFNVSPGQAQDRPQAPQIQQIPPTTPSPGGWPRLGVGSLARHRRLRGPGGAHIAGNGRLLR